VDEAFEEDWPVTTTDVPAGFRATERQPLSMELRFSYQWENITYIGTGRTRDFNANAICFEFDQDLRPKHDMELRIQWPSMLNSVCPLELVIRGPLIRKTPDRAVLRMDSYEFQTHGDHSFSQSASCGVTCDVSL
jgi:hypothetical protein